MEPKTVYKKVGKVDIFEFVQSGTQSSKPGSQAIKETLNNESHGVLYHTQDVQELDDSMIQAMTQPEPRIPKKAVITQSAPLSDRIFRKEKGGHMQMFQNERVAAFYFAKEFNEGRDAEVVISDRRRFPRLEAARPLQFTCKQSLNGEDIHFFAIVTNVSKSGLYAEFIETKSEVNMEKYLNVYDLQMLDLELYIRPTESVRLRAKLVRVHDSRPGIAMEFYESDPTEKVRFDAWIDEQQAEKEKVEQADGN